MEARSSSGIDAVVLTDSLIAKIADPRALRLIVLPTEHCNFRCSYCYEDFKIGRMSPELVTAIKRWIASRVADLERLSINWFGGEPTLALPTVLDLTQYAREALYAKSEYSRPHFRAGITTNAYRLTGDVFERLVMAGVMDYQITLDGPARIHDRRRLRADGAGTFDTIWANLLEIAARAGSLTESPRIELRIHYDGRSCATLAELTDSICEHLLPSGVFDIQFHELERLGGAGDRDIVMATAADHDHVRELSGRIARASGVPDDFRSHLATDIGDYVCYAAQAHSFVVRADGRIAKCTVALNDPRNDVGQLELDGTIAWKDGKLAPWLRALETGDRNVLACPLDGMEGHLAEELRRIRPQETVQ